MGTCSYWGKVLVPSVVQTLEKNEQTQTQTRSEKNELICIQTRDF